MRKSIMKNYRCCLLAFFLCLPMWMVAQEKTNRGISFFKGSLQEALAQAKRQDKILFVDFYAVWCGPCKRMAREVFTQDSIGAYFNKHFICLQLDAEKPENVELAKLYKVDAFPTLAFIGKDGKALSVTVGALNSSELMEAAKTALGEQVGFKQLYDQYRKEPENLQIQQQMLLQASRFLMAQDGMDAEKWVVRINKIYRSYIEAKKGPDLINKQDYIIITELGGDDKKEQEAMADFINANLPQWQQAVGAAAVYYVIEFNDQMIESLAKEGNEKYKDYVAKIKGNYKDAYAILSLEGGVTPYETTAKYADAIYDIYKNKDVATYITLMQEYLRLLGENVSPQDYGKAAQNLYYAAGDKMKTENHQTAVKWLEKALQGESAGVDRINFIVMIGDSHREMKDYDAAQRFYNQAYAESLQLSNVGTAQQMIQASIARKLATLELLRK